MRIDTKDKSILRGEAISQRYVVGPMVTPAEQGVPDIFMMSGDCVINRVLRPVQDKLPLLYPLPWNVPNNIIDGKLDGEASTGPPVSSAYTYGALYAGSKFVGRQQAAEDSKNYAVEVELKDINLSQSYLCGYLTIHNLTPEYPSLTTFFEAEIIGSNYGFETKKWDASLESDLRHWRKFPYFENKCQHYLPNSTSIRSDLWFRGVNNSLNNTEIPGMSIDRVLRTVGVNTDNKDIASNVPASNTQLEIFDYRKHGNVFMRWKEHFLVPDHRINSINGASYAGFYYVCYEAKTETIEGYYYHKDSRDFQRLLLSHRPSVSFGSFEFR